MQSLLSASAQIAHILYVKAPSEFSLLTTVSPQKKPSSRPSPPLVLSSHPPFFSFLPSARPWRSVWSRSRGRRCMLWRRPTGGPWTSWDSSQTRSCRRCDLNWRTRGKQSWVNDSTRKDSPSLLVAILTRLPPTLTASRSLCGTAFKLQQWCFYPRRRCFCPRWLWFYLLCWCLCPQWWQKKSSSFSVSWLLKEWKETQPPMNRRCIPLQDVIIS